MHIKKNLMKLNILLWSFSFAMLAGSGLATADAPLKNLKEAVQQAVLTNPDVLSRWHAYQAASNERDVAEGGYKPRVDVSAGGGLERRNDPILKKNFDRLSSSITLTQMLYDGFGTRNEVLRLDHARMVRLFELQDASETTALDTAKAYIDVMRYRRLVALAEDNYVSHRGFFDQIQIKAQAGVGRKVDLEQAAGRLALAESNLLTETSNLHDVSARYQRLVGDVPTENLLDPDTLKNGVPSDPNQALAIAHNQNPAIRATIENAKAANAALAGRDAAFKPRVDFRMRHDQGQDLNGFDGSHRDSVAEVVMTWNLYNGGSDTARVRQFNNQLDVARDTRDKACRDVRQTLEIAYNDVRKLTEQLNYLDQHQLSIEKARDAYRKQFDIGQRTLLDLLDTENELFEAKRAYANAENDLVLAYVRTHGAIGDLLPTLGVTRVAEAEAAVPTDWSADNDTAASCPSDSPRLYVADKEALNKRAKELVALQTTVNNDANRNAMKTSDPAPSNDVQKEMLVLESALKSWADAWRSQNFEVYESFYSVNFLPADGVSRDVWRKKRNKFIVGNQDIQLEIMEVKTSIDHSAHATMFFKQAYRSKQYHDVVLKTLEWEKVSGHWKIVKELSSPVN